MKLNILMIACLAIGLMTSCTKEDKLILSETDYILFGHFYGECLGEDCIAIFRLEEDKLYEDISDKYPAREDFHDREFVLLSQEKFDAVKDLIDYFPMDLLEETNDVIGQPDAGDWGGLYIEYNFDGISRFWLLDQMRDNVPTKYHEFIDKVNEKIQLILSD